MKSINTSIVLLVTGAAALSAQATPQLSAAPSTRATTVVNLAPPRGTQGIQPATIRIDYGQPHLRGRKLHQGDLVPMNSVWRLGANSATELDTGVDLVVGGATVPKGKYTLFALPTADGWKLIVNKNTGQWGTDYRAEHDLVRVDLRRRTLSVPVESFSIWLVPSGTPGTAAGELRFAWGDQELTTDWSVRQ